MEISPDNKKARLDINGEFSATELETLLRKLSLLRAQMMPPVPANREELEKMNSEVLIEDKPGLSIAARQDGGFRLWLRHRGYGWLAYQIDNLTAIGINNYLSTRVRPEVNLISKESGQRH